MSNITHDQSGGMAGCGLRLRAAREAAGLSLNDVAERLKMPVRVVRSLEEEDWSRLGAPVFIRGQLRSYARLLGLGTDPLIDAAGVAPVQPVALTPRTYTPRARVIGEQLARRAVYIVLTAFLVVPVWVAMRAQGDLLARSGSPLDMPAEETSATGGPEPSSAPLRASIASVPPRTVAPMPPAALVLKAEQDSWVQITGRDGNVLESALLKAGEKREYPVGTVAHVVLGNAPAVVVEHNGQPVDTSPWQRASVARFAVSSDGFPTQVDAGAESAD